MACRVSLYQKSCFLFDLDGTLIDSSHLHEAAFKQTLLTHAPDLLPTFIYERCKGMATAEVFRHLGIDGDSKVSQMTTAKQSDYRRRVATELQALPHALLLLLALQKAGRRLLLVTGSSQGSTGRGLTATGLNGFFEGIITADDGGKQKPAPGPYLLCIKRFGLDPAACIVIEDAENGVQSARAAGLDVVGVNNPALQKIDVDYYPDLAALGQAAGLAEFQGAG